MIDEPIKSVVIGAWYCAYCKRRWYGKIRAEKCKCGAEEE